jgi:Fe-S-cluster containining protein
MDAVEFCQHLARAADVEYDCRRCGACCLPGLETAGYVLLEPGEEVRLRARRLPLVMVPDGPTRLGTRSHEGPGGPSACIAFEGVPGFPCSCSIYDERPQKCRDFEAGSAACRLARLRAGLPV